MRLFRTPVALFFLAAGIPFVVVFTFFVISQRRALLMEPETFMTFLKQEGSAPHAISLSAWKHFLAQDQLCREAGAVVIGSSRVREIDAAVTGTSTCNLYVDGLAALEFAHLARRLPAKTSGQRQVVYVGIDHFWFSIDRDQFASVEVRLLDVSRTLWKAWAVVRPLTFFTVFDLLEAIRRVRHPGRSLEDHNNVWYPDGHLFHPRYYAEKRVGKHRHFDQGAVEKSVAELFRHGRLREANLRALETGLRALHDKGYIVRVFWDPVSPAHIASARRHYPALFHQTIDVVDRLAATLPLDRYLSADRTLDPTPFGCTERDYADLTHMDVDCMRRVFAAALTDRSVAVRH